MVDLVGLKVKVYYNLHKHCLSVQHKGRVIAHVNSILLDGVQFVVQEGGRQRVLRERKKNVHAFVVGTVIRDFTAGAWKRVSYNPYRGATFYLLETDGPIYSAPAVLVAGKDILVGLPWDRLQNGKTIL